MVRRILVHTDSADLEILRTVSTKVTSLDEAKEISKDLIDTLQTHNTGVGLAAPQIGINKRVVLINRGVIQNLVMVNPVIVSSFGSRRTAEGCLSVPNMYGKVSRKNFVTVNYYDLEGWQKTFTGSGMDAVVVQHELDHLDGKLFIDKAL